MKIKRILVEFDIEPSDKPGHSKFAEFKDGVWSTDGLGGMYPRVLLGLQQIWVTAKKIIVDGNL